jgi:hypothetical protein
MSWSAFKSCLPYQSKTPGLIIHSDVCSFEQTSQEGYSYFVTFVDDCSKSVLLYPMKSKSDTFQCFKLFRAASEKSGSHSIVALCSDNRGKYLSKEFANYLSVSGITHDPGPPHSPQSNGVAEQSNWTLNNLVQCALLNAKLPKTFWDDALRHVMHAFNSFPMNMPLGFKSPNSILNISSPTIESLHPFGCLAWYKLPEANWAKLDPKARVSILLSYLSDGNGFCLWDVERKVVIKSRNVIFDHSTFPYGSLITPSTELQPILVELPWPDSTPVLQPIPDIPFLPVPVPSTR